jgi:hypothetical protein
VTLHILTHDAMQGCGLTILVVCINDKFRDIRERNMTIRSEIWTTNTRSVGFRDIRESVTSWRFAPQCWSILNVQRIMPIMASSFRLMRFGIISICKCLTWTWNVCSSYRCWELTKLISQWWHSLVTDRSSKTQRKKWLRCKILSMETWHHL